ncbi:MAG: hypothetical protein KF903_05925 [Dokdonella sp.]|uniref:FmdE family protein n=1 Tax=Dokdonella sp. TaxID=2291710 RepID=UPI0025BB4778|nr:FmdE family protein [Dokdonella sp.]MBX3700522.1 hypothetical protein [Dokdonella sp.]MCW5577545.1 hypothetical protein [Dokdonella sp.]
MALQDFFAEAPRIRVHDALAQFLGAADDGMMEYGYADAVRLAGHSCPTVAGAFLMARAALRALYAEQAAERGAIRVDMRDGEGDGTTGVIAQVFTLVTGAAAGNGFHGIGGRFARQGLLRYAQHEVRGIARFTRVDDGHAVEVWLDVSGLAPAPQMRALMVRAMADDASAADRHAFGAVWQERVRRLLLEHADDRSVIIVERLGPP